MRGGGGGGGGRRGEEMIFPRNIPHNHRRSCCISHVYKSVVRPLKKRIEIK